MIEASKKVARYPVSRSLVVSARKLSAADVLEIRASTDSVKALALRYKVTSGAISQCLHGTTYKGDSNQA